MTPVHLISKERVDRPADDGLIDFINHELRTALTVLMCHTQLLQELALELPEAAEDSLAAIARGYERLLPVAAAFSQLVDLERADPSAPVAVSLFKMRAIRPDRAEFHQSPVR